jgi:hypothetical protein
MSFVYGKYALLKNKMATMKVAILGRGEFCKVVGEGLFTRLFYLAIHIITSLSGFYTQK